MRERKQARERRRWGMSDSNITKKALAQTMKELMAKEPFSKISVGGLCDACGMSRKSFYYHFRDKYDLVNWIFDTEFLQTIHLGEYTNGWALLEDMCTYFYSEQRFYRCAMATQGQNSFREHFCEVISPFVAFFCEDIFEGVENAPIHITFFSDAILMSMVRWLTEGAQVPPGEYMAQIRSILLRLARHTLEELGEDAPTA